MNNKVELNIPLKDKVETYLLSHSIAKRDGKRLIPIHRPILLNRTDLEIVMIYNAELRGQTSIAPEFLRFVMNTEMGLAHGVFRMKPKRENAV